MILYLTVYQVENEIRILVGEELVVLVHTFLMEEYQVVILCQERVGVLQLTI